MLTSLGVSNFDCCVVAIGTDIEASILITVMLKELGAKQVVCKALSALHARVLERVGADRVIQPEKEIGQRLAQHLGRTNVIDYIGFSDDFSILEIKRRAAGSEKRSDSSACARGTASTFWPSGTARAAWRMYAGGGRPHQ